MGYSWGIGLLLDRRGGFLERDFVTVTLEKSLQVVDHLDFPVSNSDFDSVETRSSIHGCEREKSNSVETQRR